MKLLHCYVENFGKLHKFSYTFSDTLNVIEGENGWGKSTLAVFIKAMLYGLPASRSSDLAENERKRYAPWNGEVFGGSLSIAVGDRSYRIERVFGKRESDDVFKLFSIDTGLCSDDYSANIGEQIFGIDDAGYERSTYFSQRQLSDGAGYGSIQGRLSKQEDLTLSERAFRLLDKRRKYYQMTGNRGKIAELDLAISEQRRLYEDAESQKARLDEAQKRRLDYEKAIAEADGKRREIASEADLALAAKSRRLLAETYGRLTDVRNRAEEKRAAIAREIGDKILSEDEVADLLADAPKIERMTEDETKHKEKRQKKDRLIRRLHEASILTFGLLALLAFLIPLYPLAVLSLAGLVGSIASAASVLTKQRREKANGGHSKELLALIEKRRACLASLAPIYSDASLSDDAARLSVLREKRSALTSAEQELERANADLDSFLKDHPEASEIDPSKEGDFGDPSALRVEADRIYLEIDRMRGELLSLEHEERQLALAVESIPAHAAMLKKLSDERDEAAKNLAAILRTAELLESARTSLITRYRDVVEASFIRYGEELSSSVGASFANEARSFTVSGEFDLSIVEGGVTRAPVLYSTGYRDLFALCLRFALTDALFTEESAPMILDDPFVNLDDAKLASAMRLLVRLSTSRQIIYFTCSSARIPGKTSENV